MFHPLYLTEKYFHRIKVHLQDPINSLIAVYIHPLYIISCVLLHCGWDIPTRMWHFPSEEKKEEDGFDDMIWLILLRIKGWKKYTEVHRSTHTREVGSSQILGRTRKGNSFELSLMKNWIGNWPLIIGAKCLQEVVGGLQEVVGAHSTLRAHPEKQRY